MGKIRNTPLRISNEDFIIRTGKHNIRPLQEFTGARSKMLFECYCGKEFSAWAEHILSGHVKSCGCYRRRHYAGEISANRWHRVRNDALKRNIKFEITIQQAWNLFLKQDRKCALSGRFLEFKEKRDKERQTASLDRIDSSKDYTIDNIQWVHRDINIAKHVQSHEDFIQMCKEVAEFNKDNGV